MSSYGRALCPPALRCTSIPGRSAGRIVLESIACECFFALCSYCGGGGGGPSGGILWGSAVDGDRVYAASAYSDLKNPEASGGLTALKLASGSFARWSRGNRTPARGGARR